MKWLTVPALLAAALFSVVVALPFLPGAKAIPEIFSVEVRMSSSVAGQLQVYFDDGQGARESFSGQVAVAASPEPTAYRVALPPGTYTAFRLDPIDRPATVSVSSFRILSPTGREIAAFPLERLVPVNQVSSSKLQGGALEIAVGPSDYDPQLLLPLETPVVAVATWVDYVRSAVPPIAAVFVPLVVLLLLLDRAPWLRPLPARLGVILAARPVRAVIAIAAVAVVVSAYPVVFLGKSYVAPNLGTVLLYGHYPTLPGDKTTEAFDAKLSDVGAVMWQHVPFSMMQRRALAEGELPFWNRYNALGVPLLAQGQSMFGDPLHLFVIAADGAAWAWDIKYLIAKFLFAAGLGLIVLALVRPLSASAPRALIPALLVAGTVPFIGFFLYRINHPAFFSLCYAPWPLYCLIRLAQASTVRGSALALAGLLAANLALMNSGTVKEAYMLLVCVNFSGACVLLASGGAVRQRVLKLLALGWTALLFALLTAPIWASFLQTLKQSYTGYNAVSAFQIQPSLLLGFFDEIFYRPLMAEDRVYSPSLNFFLLLGVLYFFATLRLQFGRPAILALAASSVLPLSLAFGLVPPALIVRLPFLSNIAHLDNTFSCALIVLWSAVAGVGFATAAQRLGTREGRHDLFVAGLLLFVLVFGWIAFRQAAHRPIYGPIFSVHPPGKVLPVAPFIWGYLAVLLVSAALLLALAQRSFSIGFLSPSRALLLGLCLWALVWRHGVHSSAIGFEAYTLRLPPRVDFHAKSPAVEFAHAAHVREPGRGFGLEGNFFPGWTGVYDLETIHGPDALVNPYVRELVSASGLERVWDWRLHLGASHMALARPFFDALNVRFYFDYPRKDPALAQILRPAHGADMDVYESPTAWPRAFFTDQLDTYRTPGELIAKFRAAEGRPFAAIHASDLPAQPRLAAIPRDPAHRTFAAATGYQLTQNATAFRIRNDKPGMIVLNEAYWHGDIRAELDGARVPVVRINHAFRGIAVTTLGEHSVRFWYQPKNLPRNLLLCGAGAGLLAVSLFLALRPARLRLKPHAPATTA